MTEHVATEAGILVRPLVLPCGVVRRNRLVKAATSDSLGDGAGDPTDEQIHLYPRWADGGAALSMIGELQVDPRYSENPGNLRLGPGADDFLLRELAEAGSGGRAPIWPQLGHVGTLRQGGTPC